MSKQEHLKAFLTAFNQLRNLYNQNAELKADESDEDKTLYKKAEDLDARQKEKKLQQAKKNQEEPTSIVPGKNWENSEEAKVLNDLQTLEKYQKIIKGFSDTTDSISEFTVTFNVVNSEQIIEATLQQWIKLQPAEEPLDSELINFQRQKIADSPSNKRKLGFTTFDFTNTEGEITITSKDANIYINVEPVNTKDQPIEMNELGKALTIIHETVHAKYLIDYYKEFNNYDTEKEQHKDMGLNHTSTIQEAIREYATVKGIPLQELPIDEAELLSLHGLVKPIPYLIKYALMVHGEILTESSKERLQIIFTEINERIYSLISKLK